MNEYTTFLKLGTMAILLRMLEDPNVVMRDMTLENPIRAIREISHDITCTRTVRLANGRELSALQIQQEYLERALTYATRRGFPEQEQRALDMWAARHERASPTDPLTSSRECDWVTKYHLIERYRAKHDLPLNAPKVGLIDLQYHDVNRERGLFYKLQAHDLVERICDDDAIDEAIETPPQTTRAKLRGEFIRRAKERKRDYTVDWVHLKLNDQAQRTVLCKDPFNSRTTGSSGSSPASSDVDAAVSRSGPAAPPQSCRLLTCRRIAVGRSPTSSRNGPASSASTSTGSGPTSSPAQVGPVAVGDRGRVQHHRRRPRARHRRVARRALEPVARRSWSSPGPGHIMKVRYTSAADRHRRQPRRTTTPGTDLEGTPSWRHAAQPGAPRRRRLPRPPSPRAGSSTS